ncbi:MAG: A/G-specific adenine glycosylase [Proteobacteria bacterium]|nr:A/G-specific adenine glycosylase [Pseudomonadota bacterium]
MSPLADQLLRWFEVHGRTNLPWQGTYSSPLEGQIGRTTQANIYHIWLSEVMLQQTQVGTVIDYFNRFIHHFPTLNDLANAPEDAVLAQWAGLGYYARARNLHKTAKIIARDYQGQFPQVFEQVLALPGIGRSTAGAILALGFGQNQAILDGNVKRVLSRVYQVKGHYAQSSVLKELWSLAEHHTPDNRTEDYTQAIMDLGATICTRSKPKCSLCPLSNICKSNDEQTQADYPNPKPRKNKPSRAIAMLVYQNKQGEVYLEKRPEKGIWGGLWSLVECEDSSKSIAQSMHGFDSEAFVCQQLPVFKHTFTHYHLYIHPVIIHCPSSCAQFHPIDQVVLGVPQPVIKILSQMTKPTHDSLNE